MRGKWVAVGARVAGITTHVGPARETTVPPVEGLPVCTAILFLIVLSSALQNRKQISLVLGHIDVTCR
jgi:hypothetical protein